MSVEASCAALQPLLRDAGRARLDESLAATVAAHLADCDSCQDLAYEELALDRLLEERLPQRPASLALKRRLAARLPSASPPAESRSRARRWALLAVPLAACAALVFVQRPPVVSRDPLVDEVISDHLRVVYRDQPVDVEGGGPHRVKPWLTGRLDFTVPHVYGGDDEFTLVGGAVTLFRDRKAALLVYRRQPHIVSLFVFPRDRLALPSDGRVRQQRGFSVLLWPDGDLGYALASDLNDSDLRRLGGLIANQR